MKHAVLLEIGNHPRRPGRLMLSVSGGSAREGISSCGKAGVVPALPMCFAVGEAVEKGVDCLDCLEHIESVNAIKRGSE